MEELGQLLDLIYSTALEPDRWAIVIERLADALDAGGANLSRLNAEDGRGSALLARLDPSGLKAYSDHYSRLNPFAIKQNARQFMATWKPRVTTNEDHIPRDQLLRTEYYNDFLLRYGASSQLMIDIGAIGLDFCTVNLIRDGKRDPFGTNERELIALLHPHLIRAFNLSESFVVARELCHSRSMALDRAKEGVIVVDADSRVRYANNAAERLLAKERCLTVVDGRLGTAQPSVPASLGALIAIAASSDGSLRRGSSLTLSTEDWGKLMITVAPIAPDGFSLFSSGRSVLVTLRSTQIDEAAMGLRLQETFQLTLAETRVTLALLNGVSPKGAAQKFGVSVNTIRSQIASIYGKTQTSRLADLLRLLMRTTAS